MKRTEDVCIGTYIKTKILTPLRLAEIGHVKIFAIFIHYILLLLLLLPLRSPELIFIISS